MKKLQHRMSEPNSFVFTHLDMCPVKDLAKYRLSKDEEESSSRVRGSGSSQLFHLSTIQSEKSSTIHPTPPRLKPSGMSADHTESLNGLGSRVMESVDSITGFFPPLISEPAVQCTRSTSSSKVDSDVATGQRSYNTTGEENDGLHEIVHSDPWQKNTSFLRKSPEKGGSVSPSRVPDNRMMSSSCRRFSSPDNFSFVTPQQWKIPSKTTKRMSLHLEVSHGHRLVLSDQEMTKVGLDGHTGEWAFDGGRSEVQNKRHVPESSSCPWAMLDILGAYLWVGPLVVVYWNSTWKLYDHYIFSNNCVWSGWTSAGLGFSIFALATLLQNAILSVSKTLRRPLRLVIMRVYTYITAFACVHQWRAVWSLQDCYIGVSTCNAAWTFSTAVLLLVLMRCLRVAISPPANLTLDIRHSLHYQMTTFGSAKPGSFLFVLDTFLTVCVVQPLGVTIWRGFWELLDTLLWPDVLHISGAWSLVISYSLALTLLSCQTPTVKLSVYLRDVHWLVQLLFEDFIILLHIVSCITHWRGFWLLLDAYSPYRPSSLWVAHFLSFSLLALGGAANSLLVRGCPRDGAEAGGKGVVPDTTYFSALLKRCRSKRVHNQASPIANHSHGA